MKGFGDGPFFIRLAFVHVFFLRVSCDCFASLTENVVIRLDQLDTVTILPELLLKYFFLVAGGRNVIYVSITFEPALLLYLFRQSEIGKGRRLRQKRIMCAVTKAWFNHPEIQSVRPSIFMSKRITKLIKAKCGHNN